MRDPDFAVGFADHFPAVGSFDGDGESRPENSRLICPISNNRLCILLTANWKLSQDGNTLDDDFTAIQPNGSKFNVYYAYERTAGGPGFDGTWESTSEKVN